MAAFGKAKHSFDLVLTPERTLAREDITVVLENLDKQGYHLQMPPAEDEYIEHLPKSCCDATTGLICEALFWASCHPGTDFTATTATKEHCSFGGCLHGLRKV